MIGGSCTHRNTIPSKALRHASQILYETNSLADANFQTLLKKAEIVIQEQFILRKGFYERNRVDILDGRATFLDANTITVKHSNGAEETYTADYFVIATGSRPYHPSDIDFAHPRILDSDSVLNLKDNPRSLTIYGAGVIGCELEHYELK
jgi:NAD(P) transhydrogenase